MILFRVVNDRGVWIGGPFPTREAAKAWKDRHNAKAREQKGRGDMVSLRYADGIARIDMAAVRAAERERLAATRKSRKRRVAA
jgi:hypothetical protein